MLVRIWEQNYSMLSPAQLTRKTDLFIACSSLGPANACARKLENRAVVGGRNWTRPTAVQRNGSSHFTACWTFSWRLAWDGRMIICIEESLNTEPPIGRLKVNGGHVTGVFWALWQFTGIDDFTAYRFLNWGPTWDATKATGRPMLAWWNWTLSKSTRLGLSGPPEGV
jgi:hypothetical protein